jgi:beta-mannanase
MLHLSTYHGPGTQEQISPRAIAMGRGDRYLLALGRDFTAYGHPLYLRLFAEMNNAANPYSAFRRDGSARGSAHARRWFRQAWRRIYLVVKGGHVATINARLRAVGMPHVRLHSRARWLPHPKVAVQWVPMTAGSPDIAANGPGGYWPGAGYVDWVGTDFYSRFPNFRGLDRFDATSRYAGKPFVFGEWGMWGDDDPSFMRRFFAWVGRHRRVRMLVYNQGNRTAGAFRLYRYPKAAGEMRKALRAALYTGRPTGALPAIGGKTR